MPLSSYFLFVFPGPHCQAWLGYNFKQQSSTIAIILCWAQLIHRWGFLLSCNYIFAAYFRPSNSFFLKSHRFSRRCSALVVWPLTPVASCLSCAVGGLRQPPHQPRRPVEAHEGKQDGHRAHAGFSSGVLQLLVWDDLPGSAGLRTFPWSRAVKLRHTVGQSLRRGQSLGPTLIFMEHFCSRCNSETFYVDPRSRTGE